MFRRSKPYRSAEERVGHAILALLRLIAFVLLLPVIIIAYPVVGIYILFAGEGNLLERIKSAIFWPLGLLAFNEFLSLGGLDNPTLSRITDWLNRSSGK